MKNNPVIGITLGDINGIGPEVVIKSLLNSKILKFCTPIIYGHTSVISHYRKVINQEEFNAFKIRTPSEANNKKVNIINCTEDVVTVQEGIQTKESGKWAIDFLKRAVDDLKNKQIDALVTAPINKMSVQSNEFSFPGHTEYLLKTFEAENGIMILSGEDIRVATVTGHVALSEVSEKIKRKKVISSAKALARSLTEDFGVLRPRIAVLGLNPHAGEEGMLGEEEKNEIIPAISELKNSKILAFGPYSPDGFFGTQMYRKFDGILGMYHDQVLIPFKMMAFETGVNFTAGMSAIRTSPDHGTAYDIAGSDKANESSMLNAIFTAVDIYHNRNNKNE